MACIFKLPYDVYIKLILLQEGSIGEKNEDFPFKKLESVKVFFETKLHSI